MRAVLGIDAAWSQHNDSGIALIVETAADTWRTIAVAASYKRFLEKVGLTEPQEFSETPAVLVDASRRHLAVGVDLVLVVADIPLAQTAISARRKADNEVSRTYGAQGCSTHSPPVKRPETPGNTFHRTSTGLRDGFGDAGFPLATDRLFDRCLVETYPHPALMALMQEDYRIRYKARAWKGEPAAKAKVERIEQFRAITARLADHIDGIDLSWPVEGASMAELKALEDQIDALVCAWVGIQILRGSAEPLGDSDAAIWVPTNIPGPKSISGSGKREADLLQ